MLQAKMVNKENNFLSSAESISQSISAETNNLLIGQ